LRTTICKRRTARSVQIYTATCAAGLENIVRKEIASFGGREITTAPGAVSWQGTLESAYRACLWSRFSSRILLEIARFPAPDTDTLYRNVRDLEWDMHFDAKTTFAVYTTLTDSAITHSHFASLRVKDGVVDYFRSIGGRRPNIDVRRPGIRLNLHIRGEQARLALDLSGDSLHRRGYRLQGGPAPLKESLAAAIAALSGVDINCPADTILLDPMCGSGTLLIEAALLLSDSAPGLQRQEKYFGFAHWRRHNKKLWHRLVEEALEREEKGQQRAWPMLLGYDADPKAVAAARKNVEQAGLADRIIIKQAQLARLRCPGKPGLMLTNPPYGERLSQREAVKYLYKFLGTRFAEEFSGWRLGFFSANPDLAGMVGLKWQDTHSLYNGPIKCRLMLGGWQKKPKARPQRTALQDLPVEQPGIDFANRLRKNWQRLLPWAEANNIYCFRLYDADMPEFNLAVDVYERLVHVQEYAPPKSVDQARASARFTTALAVLRQLFDLKRSQIFIKTRKPQKGKAQYQGKKQRGRMHIAHEGGAGFLINLTDYLDTGLFLDHRKTRAMIGEMAGGRTFLNLFGYTGTATVYAAMHGAAATTTVDISEKYLNRTLANLSLNGYGGPLHTTICADVMTWLRSCRERFGLIFVDPPTFSNARHRGQSFSVQQHHAELLRLSMARLSRQGTLIFSTNFRKFKMAPEIEQAYRITETTPKTLPRDFRQKGRIHRSFILQHRESNQNV
jgi:23S rRNA (guanine2445-N2)-methyltransferase / 23S rRNA (guanine2069-N7)-methyltransferase